MAKAREIIEVLQTLDPEEEIYTSDCCYGMEESDTPQLVDRYMMGPDGKYRDQKVWVID